MEFAKRTELRSSPTANQDFGGVFTQMTPADNLPWMAPVSDYNLTAKAVKKRGSLQKSLS